MTPLVLLLIPMATLLGPAPAAALYKCTAAGGSVTYQQTPCMRGNGFELEAGDAFGVRPPLPQPAPATPDSVSQPDGHRAATAGQTPGGKTIYIGPRGGRYTLTKSGRKNYLPQPAEAAGPPGATPQQANAAPQIHVGPRGGCYTMGSTGRKNYLPREQCPSN
ncbi:MAG: DUF4124 domain-containing protein [Ottowia sp.]|nr:DUF4124 domain-containing protein [Ottowia sp.]